MSEHVTIISECCQNHNGDREILKRMIHESANAGAHYCKIQAIRSHELVYRERFEEGVRDASGIVTSIKRPFAPEKERLGRLDLTPEDEAWFVDECLRAGVAPMITVFTRGAIDEVAEMGFEAVKVASYDCASYPLLRDVRQRWSRIFVSTGATTDPEIARAASVLDGSDFEFLHCVTIYPTPLPALNLIRINYLKRFTSAVGFSDHTRPGETGLAASKMAMAMGATSVERHFTVLDPSETKDGPVSVSPKELRQLVEFGQLSRAERVHRVNEEYSEWNSFWGTRDRTLSSEELANRDYYRGRFASIRNGRPVFNWEDEVFE
ncbi:MAG: general stress protein [Spirochaetaceae bacterium]|nr:general stress protein [Spirochaetaceae bacterium]